MGKFKKQKIKKETKIITPPPPPPRKPNRKVCPVCGSHAIDLYVDDNEYISNYDELTVLHPSVNSISFWGVCDDCNSSWDLTLDLDDGMITNVAWGDGDVYTNKSHAVPNSTRKKSNEFAFIPDSTPLYYETAVVEDNNDDTKGDK